MDRRKFLIMGAGSLATASPLAWAKTGEHETPVNPAEDLMQEHGLLNRILLVYDESIRRLRGGIELDGAVLKDAAELLRHFIENYHEKQEESDVFPRLEKAGKLVDLVSTLKKQHDAGRAVTAQIIADSSAVKTKSSTLISLLESFNHMYRPHEAREDTILFPAFRNLMSEKEYHELGEKFEDNEKKMVGDHGFEHAVDKIAAIEKQLGIYDLAKFTPAVK